MNNTLKNLACVAVILAALAVVGHELAGTARATGAQNHPIVAAFASGTAGAYHYVYLDNGDVWRIYPGVPFEVYPIGNIYTGAPPTAVQPQTWSQIKGAHRGK